jgi:glycosyltransferase involved in cell wall biosynthesis
MKIYYLAPFLSNIATVSSVIKSIESIKTYSKKNIEISIIDSVGEWGEIQAKTKNINIIRLYNKSLINKLPKGSFLKSRFTQLFIFIFSFFKLLKLLNKEKPDYLIAHLIVSLPLTIMSYLRNKTRLIIRISGLPRLNIFRKFYWNFFEKNVYKVTCPTIATLEKLKALNIFNHNKLHLLYDPVISPKELIFKKKEKIELNLKNKKIIIAIGRLTKQKNFSFLLNTFAEIKKKYSEYHLLILGEGEERKKLEYIINDLKLSDCVNLLGYKKNPYKYLKKAKCFILSSIWEDPGFVLLEASYLNIPIISSNCPNGPTEILQKGLGGFLFDNNNKARFIDEFENFVNSSKKDLKKKLLKSKIYSRKFTKFNHFLKIKKILDI